MELLKKLSEASGIPGHEEEIRAIIREELEGIVDEIETDLLGNIIAHKKGEGPKVAVAAHMDEIGFLVSYIDEKTGFLRVEPLGGFDPRTLIAQRVRVHTASGVLIGAIGVKPVHILPEEERKKIPQVKELFVDVGLSAEEVKKLVSVGDMVTLHQEFVEMGGLVSGKSLDDRVGIYVGIEALKKLGEHRADIYFVGTVQEEVGLRGARTSAFAIGPEIGVALDITIACDIPDAKPQERVTEAGKGVAIKLKDSTSISHPKLVQFLVDLAEEKGIPYQLEILPRGGTDAGAMQLAREGTAVVTLSIPTRYAHTAVEAAHKKDIQAAVDLLAGFLERCHEVDLRL